MLCTEGSLLDGIKIKLARDETWPETCKLSVLIGYILVIYVVLCSNHLRFLKIQYLTCHITFASHTLKLTSCQEKLSNYVYGDWSNSTTGLAFALHIAHRVGA